jgi:hypothetical protein
MDQKAPIMAQRAVHFSLQPTSLWLLMLGPNALTGLYCIDSCTSCKATPH